jgi:hypothetical protein
MRVRLRPIISRRAHSLDENSTSNRGYRRCRGRNYGLSCPTSTTLGSIGLATVVLISRSSQVLVNKEVYTQGFGERRLLLTTS